MLPDELDLRSRLLVEYAQLLFQDDQLWQIAPDYMSASGLDDGGQMLDRLVSQVNWHGDTSIAEQLLTICERHELGTAREDILRSLVHKFCRQNEWSCALSWALRMSSNELTIKIARRILQGAIPPERIGQMRIFEALSDQFVDCAELVLLYKFYSFKRHLIDGELRQAIQILHELFTDNSSPIEFHLVLFEELIRILATFQQPMVGLDVLGPVSMFEGVPGLDKEAIQDMFRALSMFQQQQELMQSKATTTTPSKKDSSAVKPLFPAQSAPLPGPEVCMRIADLMDTLRPMLAQALANCSLMH